jgi:hypothetical protein
MSQKVPTSDTGQGSPLHSPSLPGRWQR